MPPQSLPATGPAASRWRSSSWLWIVLAAAVVIAAAIASAYLFFTAPSPTALRTRRA